MSYINPPHSQDTDLNELLSSIKKGETQLPEFQRSWTWDDFRIKNIIATLTQGYPMGAIMRLEYGGNLMFQYRVFESLPPTTTKPRYLILDGQQRLTSIFQATFSPLPVKTQTDKGKPIMRFYYLDINKCLENDDRIDAILSIPEDKQVKENFDRDVKLDLSTRELEYKYEMFPVNILFDSSKREDWADGYKEYHGYSPIIKDKYKNFKNNILDMICNYKLPVITMDASTPKDAVCKVFENVNTGGVQLTVFELVTACYAVNGFNLRDDWKTCREIIVDDGKINSDIMSSVDETSFLTAITLYTSHKGNKFTSCKKKDVLNLSFEDYQQNKIAVLEGFKMAKRFLFSQSVFLARDLPYATQLIPLAAICAEIGRQLFDKPATHKILSRWYWCGIMGEMYGGANETRYANDIDDIVDEIKGKESQNRTIRDAHFSAIRLLSMQTRLSAAYKGIMALLYHDQCQDFVLGTIMDVGKSMVEAPDIHHIFPETYCRKMNFPKEKWNSIVNKTPLLPASNRSIGGNPPSIYCNRIINDKRADISEKLLQERIESHKINYSLLVTDNFDKYFIDRAKQLLIMIEKAMGKEINDKNSEQVVKAFGCPLD